MKPRAIVVYILLAFLIAMVAAVAFGGTQVDQVILPILYAVLGAVLTWLGGRDDDDRKPPPPHEPPPNTGPTTGWPVPEQYGITTPYGKRGSYWSCRKDSSGNGIHTGVDFACPSGTPLYATIAGEVRHRSYGSAFGSHQFAISPDSGQPFSDGEVFYAHARKRAADGTRVEVGDWVGESGAEGNVSGPHLHYEYHSGKGHWNCDVVIDPAATLGKGGGGVSAIDTDTIYSDKLGYGEPTNGDDSSDSIKELQHRLNGISLVGGKNIAVTGRYDDDTDAEVRKWQEQVADDTPDPAGKSYLGVAQRALMFPSPTYTVKDTGLPAIASGGGPTPPPSGGATALGRYLAGVGFVVHDDNVPVGRDSTWKGVQFLMVHHTGGNAAATPEAEAAWIRTGNEDAPLAQLMLDRNGEVWVCCREKSGQPDPGRASHAGSGMGFGVPADKMNEVSLGIEVQNDGTTPLASNAHQYEVLIALLDILAERYKVPNAKIIGHKEWSDTGKVDPLDDMDTIRADVAAYDEPTPPEPPEPSGGDARLWMDYSGKPSGELVLKDGDDWKLVDVDVADPPISGHEIHMLYGRVNFVGWDGGNGMAKVECKYVREGGDETGFDERHYEHGTKSVPLQMIHFEEGEAGRGGRWYMRTHGGGADVEVTTRYDKAHSISATRV